MRILASIFSIIMISSLAMGQSAIFLHHSTGSAVYSEGDVPEYISEYNSQNNTNIQVSERSYPNSPYSWSNYPYDFWNLWVNSGACDNAQSGIECLEGIAANKDIIIWKHCYPGAGVSNPEGDGNIASSSKTLTNYKLQYRALREKMDAFPDNDFIVWTLAPLHRLSTNQQTAQVAGEFVAWVKNNWLTEDEKDHPNIHIFDFFGIAAEQDETPANGFQYCLKYDYEKSHESSDSHPNTLANETAGPLFAQCIIDVAIGSVTNNIQKKTEIKLEVFPNPTSGIVNLIGVPSHITQASIYNMLGAKVKVCKGNLSMIDLSDLNKGVYFLRIDEEIIRLVRN